MFDSVVFHYGGNVFHTPEHRHAIYLHFLFTDFIVDESDRQKFIRFIAILELPDDHGSCCTCPNNEGAFLSFVRSYVPIPVEAPHKPRRNDENNMQEPSDYHRTPEYCEIIDKKLHDRSR